MTAVRLARPTSQLLMPFVFAGHAGSLLALTGTPVNVLVSEAVADARMGALGYFEFALVGVPLLAGTVAIAVLFGQRLLPDRRGRMLPPDLSGHARTLVEQYRLDDGLFQLRLRPQSPYVGASRAAVDLAGYLGRDGVSPQPILMNVAVAAAAAFLTPVATPTNLMVMGPGGYQFGSYWKLGLPMMIWFLLVATFFVPLFRSF